jgi:hypothetical protein
MNARINSSESYKDFIYGTVPITGLLDNNDLGTVNIQISLFGGDRTAARSEAGRGFVRPAIHFLV